MSERINLNEIFVPYFGNDYRTIITYYAMREFDGSHIPRADIAASEFYQMLKHCNIIPLGQDESDDDTVMLLRALGENVVAVRAEIVFVNHPNYMDELYVSKCMVDASRGYRIALNGDDYCKQLVKELYENLDKTSCEPEQARKELKQLGITE